MAALQGGAGAGGNFAAYHREQLRAEFKAAVALGTAKPFVIPWCLLGTFILPTLYLAFPHTQRPWLYRARFLVVAAVVALNLDMMRDTSSTNMALAYGVGLVASWGIVWSLTILVWMRPQFEAERVERRPKSTITTTSAAAGSTATTTTTVTPPRPASRAGGGGPACLISGHSSMRSNGHASPGTRRRKSVRFDLPPDADVARSLDHFEYYWQAYPADSPFLTRLGWAADLCLAWRGSGWNFAIHSIPSYQRPEKPLSGELVKLATIPLVSRAGYRRYRTCREFLRAKAISMFVGYLVLDLCAVVMTKDPYFVFGPEAPVWLPPHLAGLHPLTLSAYRSAVGFAGVVAALHMILSFWQIVTYVATGPLLLRQSGGGGGGSTRGELWHYPTIFGSFEQVLDHGLAGFWGSWWHQSFRLAFAAPTAWLVRNGYLGQATVDGRQRTPTTTTTRLVGLLIAFAQSSFLHASGSITSLPRTKWWLPPLFFLLSCAGIVLQDAFCRAFRRRIDDYGVPRVYRRVGNLLFVVLWLHLTQWAFIGDLARSALWLFEPVPISPLRWLGFGAPGDSWWRWDRDFFGRWYTGKHWWLSGLGF